jgi:hypothetical protein
MNSNAENAEVARALLVSTATYVARHVENPKNKLAYVRAASRCQELCSEVESGNDLSLMKHKLFALRYNVSAQFKKSWFNRETEYYSLAIQHAIEAIDSISIRFVNGYSGKDELLFLNVLEGATNEHQICACLARFGQTKG